MLFFNRYIWNSILIELWESDSMKITTCGSCVHVCLTVYMYARMDRPIYLSVCLSMFKYMYVYSYSRYAETRECCVHVIYNCV